MKEVSPFVIAMEMFKKNISINDRFHLVRNNSEFRIILLSDINRASAHNSIMGCRTDWTGTITFGWNKSNLCVVLFLNEREHFIRLYNQEKGMLNGYVRQIDIENLNEDDIFQLTLEYGISKVELSDELYEFIFGA